MTKPRILFCITVYGGSVQRSIESAVRMNRTEADYDVLILDDASPKPGWSEELAKLCDLLGVRYYRNPRNLGIPRNMNLGLLAGVEGQYDHVVINNSDVIFPNNLLTELLKAQANDNVGSVTAWSNNVWIYSLPNTDPDKFLTDQNFVDWVSATLARNYSGQLLDIPAGVAFCILIPTKVIQEVGLMDPVFGRGYYEETDWCLRSLAAGYRVGLALGTFVYHLGYGSTRSEAGINAGALENAAIVNMRYPTFFEQLRGFTHSELLQKARADATELIIKEGAMQFGYTIEVGWQPRTLDDFGCRVIVSPDRETPTI